MSMRTDWQSAKKTSETNFKKAYDNWRKEQQKQAKSGDKKARKDFLKEIGEGHEYTKPMSFKGGLGPVLDKIEKAHAKAEDALDKITVEVMLKNKAVNGLWKTWAEKVSYTDESYHFLNSGFKLSPDKLYSEYIATGSNRMLNIDSGLKQKWDDCAQNAAKFDSKSAKPLIKPTVEHILSLVSRDSVSKFRDHPTMSKFLRESLGGKDVPKLIKEARTICMQYARQSQAYGKRWAKQKPDFWTPINSALNDILTELNKIAELYPK